MLFILAGLPAAADLSLGCLLKPLRSGRGVFGSDWSRRLRSWWSGCSGRRGGLTFAYVNLMMYAINSG